MSGRRRFLSTVAVMLLLVSTALAQSGGELRFCLRSEPKTLNPLLVQDDASETIRYLTGGVLVRVNRLTQALEPELAKQWQVSKDGRTITFDLRDNLHFSDGTPFSAEDVAWTLKQMFDPNLHSPTGDSFGEGARNAVITVGGPNKITITFPSPIAGLDRLFDQVAIMSSKSPKKELAALGPFYVADQKAGSYVVLNKNPNYWRKDANGKQLPYLESVRLEIQSNRDIEIMRFRRGEFDLINSIDAEYFEKLASAAPNVVRDAGPSLDTEQVWFNQVPGAPIPDYKKAWFQSQKFRAAISNAINRADIARVVFGGHAAPAYGPVSPANKFWFNAKLPAPVYDPTASLKLLQADGFHVDGRVLRDRAGNAVEFSVVTNAGNKYRERIATMMQQDLEKVGIKLNVVTLDFPSLIERITSNFNYEAALLGLVNDELDPNGQMNVWLSSAENHQWNPNQKQPATAWEAELDRLMKAQAATIDRQKRKEYFDKVQQIVAEQLPFIYLVNKNALSAVGTGVQGVHPVILRPQTYWNIAQISLAPELARSRK